MFGVCIVCWSDKQPPGEGFDSGLIGSANGIRRTGRCSYVDSNFGRRCGWMNLPVKCRGPVGLQPDNGRSKLQRHPSSVKGCEAAILVMPSIIYEYT